MKAVGIRELKAMLSGYIRLVRAGEEVLVTDRGEAVAELRQPRKLSPEPDRESGIEKLVRKGCMTPGVSNNPTAYPKLRPVAKKGMLARLLDEERGG